MRKSQKKIILTVCLAAVLVLTFRVVWSNIHFVTTRLTVISSRLPAGFTGFKIAQVSDLHNHPWGERLTDRLRQEAPDMIAVTGDLVDSSHTDFDTAMEFVEQAVQIAPVYYVTGNHEAWLETYSVLEKRLRAAGVHMMDNGAQWLTRGGDRIRLAGVQDPDFQEGDLFEGVQASIVDSTLQKLLSKDAFNVVLCHRPELLDTYAAQGVDVVLTGHAHGGQVRIPFVGGLIAPNQGFFPKYTEGIYEQGNTRMVVSRGLGNSVIPVRINNPPELVIVTLEQGL